MKAKTQPKTQKPKPKTTAGWHYCATAKSRGPPNEPTD